MGKEGSLPWKKVNYKEKGPRESWNAAGFPPGEKNETGVSNVRVETWVEKSGGGREVV